MVGGEIAVAVPPWSLVTIFFSVSVGALAVFVISQVTCAPSGIDTRPLVTPNAPQSHADAV